MDLTDGVDADGVVKLNKLYFCSFKGCSMKFDRPSRLQWHIRNHTGDKPYKCSLGDCGKAYATTTKLKRHVRTFHKLTDLVLAADTEKLKDDLVEDMEKPAGWVMSRVHGVNYPNDWPVSSPSGSTSTTTTARSCSEVGESEHYKYKCFEDGCNKSFKRRSNLYNHRVVQHERRANFSCPAEGCGQSFTFPTLLRRHAKTHEGYRCKQCPLVFSNWTEVRKHVSVDHKRVHQCSSCSKTFKRPCDLHRHELTHSGARQRFTCTEEGCGKSYDRVSTLRKHIRAQHHGELPHQCALCVAAFPHLADLKRHEKYHNRTPSTEKKSYPAKGHRRIALLNRLIGEPCPPPPPSSQPFAAPGSDHETHIQTEDTHPSQTPNGVGLNPPLNPPSDPLNPPLPPSDRLVSFSGNVLPPDAGAEEVRLAGHAESDVIFVDL